LAKKVAPRQVGRDKLSCFVMLLLRHLLSIVDQFFVSTLSASSLMNQLQPPTLSAS